MHMHCSFKSAIFWSSRSYRGHNTLSQVTRYNTFQNSKINRYWFAVSTVSHLSHEFCTKQSSITLWPVQRLHCSTCHVGSAFSTWRAVYLLLYACCHISGSVSCLVQAFHWGPMFTKPVWLKELYVVFLIRHSFNFVRAGQVTKASV